MSNIELKQTTKIRKVRVRVHSNSENETKSASYGDARILHLTSRENVMSIHAMVQKEQALSMLRKKERGVHWRGNERCPSEWARSTKGKVECEPRNSPGDILNGGMPTS